MSMSMYVRVYVQTSDNTGLIDQGVAFGYTPRRTKAQNCQNASILTF